ncbi:phage BR0599 family protein [Acinetobacter sp. ANC 7454]|uniref:phage BR0599 family protein n=1 Tax=Acinetobacter thermotolerans TaxID=3151487 RepID=UPI00325AE223
MKFLYHFWHGDQHWYFTNARKAVTFDDVVYYPIRGLQHSKIEDAGIEKCDIDVTFPQPHLLLNENEHNLAQIFINKIYYQGVKVEIFELDDGVPLFNFRGRVVVPAFDEDNDTMTLNCSSHESDFKRTIFTQKFQRTCPYSIYDMFCGLDIEEWSFEARITSVNGTAFSYEVLPTQVVDEDGDPVFEQVPLLDENDEPVLDEDDKPIMVDGDPVMEVKTYPSGYLNQGLLFKDGIYTWLRDGGNMYRPHFGLAVNDIVKLAPGCDQSRKTCHEKFDNHKRFGGHINIPNEDVTTSQIIK